MWLCLNNAFVSVIAFDKNKDLLVVRSRRKKHLSNLLGEDARIFTYKDRDYRYRTFVRRKDFAKLIAGKIEGINYQNFKNSVKENELHDLYARFWSLHKRYQDKFIQNNQEENSLM